MATKTSRFKKQVPAVLGIVAYFLSAIFFVSQLFTFFSLLPLLILYMRKGARDAALSAVACTILITFVFGVKTGVVYFLAAGVPIITLPRYLFVKKWRVDSAIAAAVGWMLLGALAVSTLYARSKGLQPFEWLKVEFSSVIDDALQLSGGTFKNPANPTDLTPEDLKKEILVQLPSLMAIFSLLSLWANLLLLYRFNPEYFSKRLGVSRGFFSQWKVPEWLVWPTIAAGATLIFDWGNISLVGINVFRFCMTVYGLQGLAVFAVVFDRWRLSGFLRSVAYVLILWPLMPLLLGVGFFDLWFDFRARLRQT